MDFHLFSTLQSSYTQQPARIWTRDSINLSVPKGSFLTPFSQKGGLTPKSIRGHFTGPVRMATLKQKQKVDNDVTKKKQKRKKPKRPETTFDRRRTFKAGHREDFRTTWKTRTKLFFDPPQKKFRDRFRNNFGPIWIRSKPVFWINFLKVPMDRHQSHEKLFKRHRHWLQQVCKNLIIQKISDLATQTSFDAARVIKKPKYFNKSSRA